MSISLSTEKDIPRLTYLVNVAFRGLAFDPTAASTGQKDRGWTDEAHLVEGPRVNPADPAELRNSENVKIVKYEDSTTGKIVGFVRMEKGTDGKCQIGMLSVHPEHQAAGIGSKLMEFAESWAKENFNCSTTAIRVVSCRTSLIDYYTRRGYQETGDKTHFPFPLKKGAGVPKVPVDLIGLEKSLN